MNAASIETGGKGTACWRRCCWHGTVSTVRYGTTVLYSISLCRQVPDLRMPSGIRQMVLQLLYVILLSCMLLLVLYVGNFA